MLNDTERKRERQRAPAQLLEATVLSPALNAAGWLRVELDVARGVAHACPWPDNGVVPNPGDAAAVMESDHGNYWAVGVWAND